MLLEKIPLGKTLDIFVEREDYRYRLVSKVEDTNEIRVCVTAIASNGRYFSFLPTDRVKVVYRDRDNMWEWDNVKAGLAALDGYPVHYFQIVDEGKSANRRNAYRVQLLEEVVLKYYKIPGQPKKYSDVPKLQDDVQTTEGKRQILQEPVLKPELAKAMIKDISENGAGIYSDEKFELEDEVSFRISSTYGDLELKASIIRKAELPYGEKHYKYYYGCIFTKSDRKLLPYIFDLQRELLKRQREREGEQETQ